MPINWLSSMGNNIVERARNPFLGTFAFVWLARNWELVFALFNFDDSYTLESKISFLTDRIKYDAFWTELGWNILWTFTILIITYILINLARIISNLFEKRLTPIIMKMTDYKSLVPKKDYQGVLLRMNDLQERLDKEIQEKLRFQGERDKSEEEVNRLNLEIIEMGNLSSEAHAQKTIDKGHELEDKSDSKKGVSKADLMMSKYDKIAKNFADQEIETIIQASLLGEYINPDKHRDVLSELIRIEFLVLSETNENGWTKYQPTLIAREVLAEL